jgi:hypothetical protein
MTRAVCAASARCAPGRTSCKRQVSGSNPLTGSTWEGRGVQRLVCRFRDSYRWAGMGVHLESAPDWTVHCLTLRGIWLTTFSAACRDTSLGSRGLSSSPSGLAFRQAQLSFQARWGHSAAYCWRAIVSTRGTGAALPVAASITKTKPPCSRSRHGRRCPDWGTWRRSTQLRGRRGQLSACPVRQTESLP